MSERPEPYLAERLWTHPSALASDDVTVAAVRDAAGSVVEARYSDGARETYGYDAHGRVVTIDEHPDLWLTVECAAHRRDSGGRLTVAYDERGAVRIAEAGGAIVWERRDEPWAEMLERGARSLAERCASAIARTDLDPDTEAYCLMLVYVGDGGLHTLVNLGTEEDRREVVDGDMDAFNVACNLWYPESDPVSFVEVEDDPGDQALLREAALTDPREPQRTVLTEAAKLLARRDWTGVFRPTGDFVVYIAEHDESFAPKHASVREVNPPERLAAWDASWPEGVTRGEDELTY